MKSEKWYGWILNSKEQFQGIINTFNKIRG